MVLVNQSKIIETQFNDLEKKIKVCYQYSRLSLIRSPLAGIRLETTPLSLGKETGQVTINDLSQRNAWNVVCA